MEDLSLDNKPSKISKATAILMVAVAALYELIDFGLTFIPVVGDPIGTFLLGVITDLHFFIWFKMKGVSYTKKPSRAILFFASAFGELLPVIQEFATVGILVTILSVWTEEKIENSTQILSPNRNSVGTLMPQKQNGAGFDRRSRNKAKEDELILRS